MAPRVVRFARVLARGCLKVVRKFPFAYQRLGESPLANRASLGTFLAETVSFEVSNEDAGADKPDVVGQAPTSIAGEPVSCERHRATR